MEKQLRVLNVTLDYPPPLFGGYGAMCAQVCTWLKQRGHEVLVLTTLPIDANKTLNQGLEPKQACSTHRFSQKE